MYVNSVSSYSHELHIINYRVSYNVFMYWHFCLLSMCTLVNNDLHYSKKTSTLTGKFSATLDTGEVPSPECALSLDETKIKAGLVFSK